MVPGMFSVMWTEIHECSGSIAYMEGWNRAPRRRIECGSCVPATGA
jgi:hypothetical protein